MKTMRTMVLLLVLAAFGIGGCTATLSKEDQAKLDAALKASDQAAASAQQADAAAKQAADSAARAEAAAKRSEAAAAQAEDSAAKAAKAFEMGLRK